MNASMLCPFGECVLPDTALRWLFVGGCTRFVGNPNPPRACCSSAWSNTLMPTLTKASIITRLIWMSTKYENGVGSMCALYPKLCAPSGTRYRACERTVSGVLQLIGLCGMQAPLNKRDT